MKTNRIDHPTKIGLFGGTFNPIHIGHLQSALDVLTQFSLELIYFIPSALPPHKTKGILATARNRSEMVRLTIENYPQLNLNDIELNRTGPSYTIDTIRYFKTKMSTDSKLYFILGVDAFMEIHTWKNFLNLFEEVAFIVMSRPQGSTTTPNFETAVESFVQRNISLEFKLSAQGQSLIHPRYQTIHLTRVVPIDIASSKIRQMIRNGKDITQWVDPGVAHYIRTKGLYR